jgi:signal transduction histidine kinase
MLALYYYVVFFSGVVSCVAAAAVYWKNRFHIIGPLFGLTMVWMGLWMFGFAQYYRRLDPSTALFWAQVTMTASILAHAFWFHTMCELAQRRARLKWVIATSYLMGLGLLVVLWSGNLLTGLKAQPHMQHYVSYQPRLYPALMLYLMGWQGYGIVLVAKAAWEEAGYRRTQLVYFIGAWAIIFMTTSSVIFPLQYEVSIPPFGFFLLPVNLIFLAYVMIRSRLADYNIVVARVFLYSITMVVIVGISLLFVGGMTIFAPGFMNQEQLIFALVMSTTIGLGLMLSMPRLLPRAERIMQERLFGSRAGYQDALSGLMRQLSTRSNIDELLGIVATTVHSQMQLSRVLILMEDVLTGDLRLRAESGVASEFVETLELTAESPVLEWLQENRTVLVRDELMRRLPELTMKELAADLDRLGVSVCVPTIVDGKITGVLCLGEKNNRAMFYMSDLNLLTNLATELALIVKYRRVEEEIFRKNKLIELGTIAAGVAHEIRNPLASIRTFAQLLPERSEDPEFKTEFSKMVVKDVDRITKVIESMLAFARPAQVTLAEHSTVDLVEDAILLTQAKLKSKNIELTKHYHDKPVVRVDKQKIQQVLINLISNAVDAVPEKGKIRVATGERWMEDSSNGNRSRHYAVIEVADNGPGIPASVRSRLFDPFYTTKKEGTGLGLSISQKIVRDHNGTITLTSIEGKGTTFQVNLPLE